MQAHALAIIREKIAHLERYIIEQQAQMYQATENMKAARNQIGVLQVTLQELIALTQETADA
jgi:hypothetical protein